MTFTRFSFRGLFLVLWVTLGVFSANIVIDAARPSLAEAAKRKRRRSKRKRNGKRRGKRSRVDRGIKRERNLSRREDAKFVDEATATKDLRNSVAQEQGPQLNIDELEATQAQDLAEDKLNEEVELVEELLQFENRCTESAPARFRLADLYWERSKRDFFKTEDFSLNAKQRSRYADSMKRYQNSTVKSYEAILQQCPTYEETPRVLFYLGKALVELDRAEEGAQHYKEIIQNYADSAYVANAWFGIGEYYFDGEGDPNKALRAYKRAASFTGSQVYGFAVYKQGWCYVNTGDWDLALERFREVISISNDTERKMDSKGRISLRRQGLNDYVRAYAQVGDPRKARKTFVAIGGQDDLPKMMERLGNWYISQGDHRAVITVYRDLISTFPKSPRLPVFQGKIVDASSRMGDKKATVAQAEVLTDYFDQVRSSAALEEFARQGIEQEKVQEDLAEAEEIAENTLRRLAMEYHRDAKKLRGTTQDRTYKLAHDLYKHYLTVFPEPRPNSDVNYVFFMRFYFAEVLYKLEEFRASAENYDRVVAMNPEPKAERDIKIVLAASEESVRAWDEVVSDLDRTNPPQISGTTKKEIPAGKMSLIKACELYTTYVRDDRYKRYVEASEDDIVGIAYKMARVYYTYNHFDKAAPAFNDIVNDHPEHEVACYSANLALDIYNGQKNYRAMVDATGRYLANQELACSNEDRAKFTDIQEKSTFGLIEQEYEKPRQYVLAAEAYKRFEQRFKRSDLADDAAYNASVNYDLAGRLNLANQMREYLVKAYPNSELVPETLYNIAQSYERVVDFRNAASYYETFFERYPEDKRSRDALFNAGVYRATLGEFDKSRGDRERYVSKYSNAKDVHFVAFAKCQTMEQQASVGAKRRGAWNAALTCYEDLTKNRPFARQQPDLLCQARFRRAEIMLERMGDRRGYEKEAESLVRGWPRLKNRHGLNNLPECANVVAELRFRALKEPVDNYKNMTIAQLNPTDRGIQKFQSSVREKVLERNRLRDEYQQVVETGVATWGLASLYQIGELFNDAAQKLLNVKIPDRVQGVALDEENKSLLRQKLSEEARPAIQEAVAAYELCMSRSNELGVYSQWSLLSLRRLQKLAPEQYQPLNERLTRVGYQDSAEVEVPGAVILDGENYKRIPLLRQGGSVPTPVTQSRLNDDKSSASAKVSRPRRQRGKRTVAGRR